jgi:hypothetical protein
MCAYVCVELIVSAIETEYELCGPSVRRDEATMEGCQGLGQV